MALQVSPISRNLALKVTVMFLEVEDMLALGFACAVVMLGRTVPLLRPLHFLDPHELVSGSGGVGTRDSGPDAIQIRQAAEIYCRSFRMVWQAAPILRTRP